MSAITAGQTQVVMDGDERDDEPQRLEVAEQATFRKAGAAASQLQSLQQVTAAFARALTSEQVADEVVRHSIEQMGAGAVWLVTFDQQRTSLHTVRTVDYAPEVVARHETLSWDAPLPLVQVARTGQALWYQVPEELLARSSLFAGVQFDVASVALIPLSVDSECMGAFELCFARAHDFSAVERDYLLTLGRVAGQTLRRSEQYETEHAIAAALQHELLPVVPKLSAIESCVRYRPARAEVGGDWYSAIELPDGLIAMSVGDVAGHDPSAAAVMGQIRSALRACKLSDDNPGTVLTLLNTVTDTFPGMTMATLFYGLYDPAGELRYVSAGHPPPLIKGRDGRVRPLFDGPPSLPIGVQLDMPYTTSTARLEPGETLAAYTDGLVERRDQSINAGIARLADTLATGPDDLDALCDYLLAHGPSKGYEDDTALLVLRPKGSTQRQ